MMRDKLTRREDRALLRALRELVLTKYPNPDRKGCPGTLILKAIATKRIAMLDPAHEHVANCSPCFKELTDIQQRLRRRDVLLWAVTVAGTAIVVIAVLFPYFAFRRQNTQIKPQTVQTEHQAGTSTTAQRNPAVEPPPAAQTEPRQSPELALLDLRNVSAVRAIERPQSDNANSMGLPRALLKLTVQLPVGSAAGSYEIQLRDSDEKSLRSAKGEAVIENGITKLLVNIDTRPIQPGEYQFAWRLEDFSWRQYPILIR